MESVEVSERIAGIFAELGIDGDVMVFESPAEFWRRKLVEVYDKVREREATL